MEGLWKAINSESITYQDVYLNGEVIKSGTRECESRYKVIRNFLERFNREKTFTILDFGANYGYFSWRIKKDFPNAQITMVDNGPVIKELYRLNNHENVELINKQMTVEDLREFKKNNHFDTILVMSILHHFKEDYKEVTNIFLEMGDNVVFEVYPPNVPGFTGISKEVSDYVKSKGVTPINNWTTQDRPIYYKNKNEYAVCGVVNSGSGEAQLNTKYFNKKFKWFGLEMCPRTLNVQMEQKIFFSNPLYLVNRGNWKLVMIPLYINGFPAFAVRPETEDYPGFVEILSPANLREKFNLKDSDGVFLSFNLENIRDLNDFSSNPL